MNFLALFARNPTFSCVVLSALNDRAMGRGVKVAVASLPSSCGDFEVLSPLLSVTIIFSERLLGGRRDVVVKVLSVEYSV